MNLHSITQLNMNKIARIERKKGFDYRVDKNGNVIESKYRWIKDKSTIVMLVILLLGGLYYVQAKQSATNAANFDEYCMLYQEIREDFILNNPGEIVNLENVFEYYDNNRGRLNELNIQNG